AINSSYINRIAKQGSIYRPGVFYCRTAFEGLKVMNKLMSGEKTAYLSEWEQKLEKWKEKVAPTTQSLQLTHSGIRPVLAPTPAQFNQRIRIEPDQIDLSEVWNYINKKSLFILSWGFRGASTRDLSKEADNLFKVWKNRVIEEKLFDPRAVYGF